MVGKIAVRGVALKLREYVPDSGQEHTAYANDSFLVTTASFKPAVTFLAFRIFVRMNDSVCYLYKERLDVDTGAGNTSAFALAATGIITGTAARP